MRVMRRSVANEIIQVVEGERLAFRAARNQRLECTAGRVWLTIEGQPGDFLIAQGGQVNIESNGLALVEGMPFGAIRLVRDAPCGKAPADAAESPYILLPTLTRLREAVGAQLLGFLKAGRFSP